MNHIMLASLRPDFISKKRAAQNAPFLTCCRSHHSSDRVKDWKQVYWVSTLQNQNLYWQPLKGPSRPWVLSLPLPWSAYTWRPIHFPVALRSQSLAFTARYEQGDSPLQQTSWKLTLNNPVFLFIWLVFPDKVVSL